MASQAQIDANRRNSQKSTGPRTDAGKAASSQNATRSGLYAASLLIDGEDPDDLETLARHYHDTCRPVGPREVAVVESLIHSDWLLRRMRLVETQDWNREFKHLRKTRGDEFDETAGLVIAYIRIEERLERVQRRITTLERLYHRRLAELERLQSQRPPEPGPEAPPSPSPEPLAPVEIGFVPSNLLAPSLAASPVDDGNAISKARLPVTKPLASIRPAGSSNRPRRLDENPRPPILRQLPASPDTDILVL